MKLTSGNVTIPVERDGVVTGELAFDPQDVGFIQRFYELVEGLEEREKAWSEQQNLPMKEKLVAMSGLCGWVRGQLDEVFGDGTSQMLFGQHSSPRMFKQFFEELEPHIRKARGEKLAKYKAGDEAVMK